MTDWKKKIAVLLLGCGSVLFACGPYFPPTFIDEEDARVHGVDERELVYYLSLLSEHFMRDVIPPSPRSAEKDPKAPRREYELYKAGVKEITANPKECFPKAWKQLLELPPAERRYRTVRTLYMLGNLALRNREDDKAAWKFYHDLRKAVRNEGFPDNLGLSLDTFNALRRYSSPLGQLRYLPLAARFNASKVVYQQNLEEIVARLSAEERKRALQDPYLAELLLLADPKSVKSGPHKFLLADRLAMRAYQKGNFELCADLLKQTPDNSLIKLFLQARLARFKGDNKQAVLLLRQWLKLSETALESSPKYIFRRRHTDDTEFNWRQEVHGLIGLITLEEKDYQEALLAFMKAGSWPDAALIAEQYINIPALKKFIDSACCQCDANMTEKLRHLLARALLRLGKIKEACNYFPWKYDDIMKEYLKNWEIANSPKTEPEIKTKALFRIGQIQMLYNIELLGYEMDPDFYICKGQCDYCTPEKMRRSSKLPRFHYRKTIAETFDQAAKMTNSEKMKFVSWLAAGWTLRNTQPEAAKYYYRQLCKLGLEPVSGILIRRQWFPELPAKWREKYFEIKPTEDSLSEYIDKLAKEWQSTLLSERWHDVRIMVKNIKGADLVEIQQNGRKVFSLQTCGHAQIVRFEQYISGDHRRGYMEALRTGEDFRKYLIDLKGDGDKRHLIIAEWSGGNSAFDGKGYLLDAKDNFKYLGEVPVGEAYDYPMPNPNLEFWDNEIVEYFGASGSAVLSVPFRLKNGKRVCIAKKIEKFDHGPYRKMLKSKNYTDKQEFRRMVFMFMYADLASHGLLKKGPEYAFQLGYNTYEVRRYRKESLALIHKCKFWKYLEKINE